MHIAEFNIAYRMYEIDDPRFADFVNNLDRVNALAERSKGFVWRLKDDNGTQVNIDTDIDPKLLPNLSVWESADDLRRFTFNTIHARIFERREEWFPVLEERHFVMWQVPVGHRPTLGEAFAKLDRLNLEGPSDEVFGWEALKQSTESASEE
ncbi:MAG: DUF3291 domain-containing protein [Hyphomicrobiales bacterium]|nr:DUF3291 domain-containing protein [Hyphomicrobiales bacterium]MCP5001544.1 DUF3291 domain-containing protein [Hyphomicrobiales bacterium]